MVLAEGVLVVVLVVVFDHGSQLPSAGVAEVLLLVVVLVEEEVQGSHEAVAGSTGLEVVVVLLLLLEDQPSHPSAAARPAIVARAATENFILLGF